MNIYLKFIVKILIKTSNDKDLQYEKIEQTIETK